MAEIALVRAERAAWVAEGEDLQRQLDALDAERLVLEAEARASEERQRWT